MPETRSPNGYPENPVVVRVTRAGVVESVHRGAWCLVDVTGRIVAGAGAVEHAYFARSSIKSLQVLPLLESGAAERFRFSDEELALAIASHGGERAHVETVHGTLERLGFGVRHLRCGAHAPFDSAARAELQARGESPSALHNNCSGKHAGFLALGKHLEEPPEAYLDPGGRAQREVRAAIADMTALPARELVSGTDGCSAPTYCLSLAAIATAFARLCNPEALPSARRAHAARLTRVAGAHPTLIGGSRQFLDTEILRATRGRIFPKIGAEAIHALGVVGGGLGLALKIDDGGARALNALVLGLLEAFDLARADELERLASLREQRLHNFAGLPVGTIDPVLAAARRR